jgi:hypothetical protein
MLIQQLSKERLRRYGYGEFPEEEVILRYTWNIKLSESLYPLLSLLEVALRNQLDSVLTLHFGCHWLAPEWLSGKVHKSGAEFQEVQALQKALKSTQKFRDSRSKVVAELTFGFWTGLFKPAYHSNLWNAHRVLLREVFPNGRKLSPKKVYLLLTIIRQLRNRIAHYEPIFDRPTLHNEYALIREALQWMGDDLYALAVSLDHFYTVWDEQPESISDPE